MFRIGILYRSLQYAYAEVIVLTEFSPCKESKYCLDHTLYKSANVFTDNEISYGFLENSANASSASALVVKFPRDLYTTWVLPFLSTFVPTGAFALYGLNFPGPFSTVPLPFSRFTAFFLAIVHYFLSLLFMPVRSAVNVYLPRPKNPG